MYNKTVLDNGVRLITERLEHLRSISLGIWVDVGSRDETVLQNGITHFVEHMLFKGTKERSSFQIAKELDAIGGMSNAFTGKEQTCFHARVLGRHFKPLARIFADIFLNSTFNPGDMDRERQVILQEISMVEDTPDDNIHVLFGESFWRDQPIGMSILGTHKTVGSMTRQTVLDYIQHYYVPEKIIVAVAGDVDHEDMVSFFHSVFANQKRGNHSPGRVLPESHGGVAVYHKSLEQVHICLGGEAPSLTSEHRFSCAILNTILGGNMSSRLFQEIRENLGLAYVVYSFLSTYMDTGLLGVYLATDTNNVNAALQTIQKEISKISQGELSEDDLAAAKEYLIGNIYLSSESADSRMMRIAKNEFIFGRYVPYEELISCVESVSKDDVVQMSNGIFKDDKVSLTTLGPFQEGDLDRSTLMY